MEKENNKFWPYNKAKSAIASAIIFIVLSAFSLLLHYWIGWPHGGSVTVILIGILIVGILPILLALLDTIITQGGKIELKYFTIDFSKFTQTISPGITIPANIGVQGVPVYITNLPEILDALKEARSSSIIVIDIEDGKVWWETRLFVLLSGAVRIGTPGKIIFVEKVNDQDRSYIGWANPSELFEILMRKPEYKISYATAEAIAKQCELVEPFTVPPIPNTPPQLPFSSVAWNKETIAFDPLTGVQADFLHEQLLQNQLGKDVEAIEQGKKTLNLTHSKLTDMFCKVLKKDILDETWSKEKLASVFFESDTPYFILTNNGKYMRMVSRLSILNEMFKNLVLNDKDKNEPK